MTVSYCIGDRVRWFKNATLACIRAVNDETQTVDLEFIDGSTRGVIPFAEIIHVDSSVPWKVIPRSSTDMIFATGIESRETLGQFK